MIEEIDLEPELPESDNLFGDVTTHSDPVPVNLSSDPKTSDSVSFPDHKLGDKSIRDITQSEFAHLSGHTFNSSTNSTTKILLLRVIPAVIQLLMIVVLLMLLRFLLQANLFQVLILQLVT